MKLLLCDKNEEIVSLCADIEGLEVATGDIFDKYFDALITPGNSYAFMDSGFDLIISQRWGWHIQKDLQETWVENCHMIPVGSAITRHITDNQKLIYAPTMQVPMDISNTWNVYLAMKAGLQQAKNYRSKKAAFPAFGCGCGNMNPKIFKKQLQFAIQDYDRKVKFNSWQEAQAYHFNLLQE